MSSYREQEESRERRVDEKSATPELDGELEVVLRDFRSSVHAWSEAELSRPRTVQTVIRHRGWRLAAGWALGCALIAGGVSGTVYERHRQAEVAKIRIQQQQQEAALEREQAAQRAQHAEEELAKENKEVARDVPAAMEPLAQLMGEDDSQ